MDNHWDKKTHCIINPQSNGGETKTLWETKAKKLLTQSLGPFTSHFTKEKGDGEHLARHAITEGAQLLIVMGGDGTISEVVNGCFSKKTKAKKNPIIAILNSGSGGDFSRTLGIPRNLELAVGRIKNGDNILVDVGYIYFHSLSDTTQKKERYFINAVSLGLSGKVVRTLEKEQKIKKYWKRWGYLIAATKELALYKNPLLSISIDEAPFTNHSILTQAICNGRFFGGGMRISPDADICDGLLSVATISNWGFFRSLWHTKHFYKGSLSSCKGVSYHDTQNIRIQKAKTKYSTTNPSQNEIVIVEGDGELLGTLPIKVKIIPNALYFRV